MTDTQTETHQGITYKKTNGLNIIKNETEITLRKGALHQTELVIDKESSSPKFIALLEAILDGQEVTIEPNHVHQNDFKTLYSYGLIRNKIKQGFTLLMVEDQQMFDAVKNFVPDSDVVKRSEIISDADIDLISSENNYLKTDAYLERIQEVFTSYSSIYYIATLNERHNVQTINKLMVQLDQSFFMALFDNENFLLLGVEPKLTGCYECLEKKILSRIQFQAETQDMHDDFEVTPAELLVGLGLIRKNIEQTEVNGMSMLTGAVLYYYFPNFEYSFDFNRRTILCNTCAGINKVDFNEQNAASVNITKELIDYED
ncbi:hypothetical protein [Virgibacillus alimentarius]|uniref:hypothetical protein n=1 Tax=Virgibacillus alimentarius TaxID=698769 RepID=UPI0004931C86|nr:hypothetical protein [Virgibacillus alimentarius]